MDDFSEKLLRDSYEHFVSTGERKYVLLPTTPTYLMKLLPAVQDLYSAGYINDLSDNLIDPDVIHLAPVLDHFSFTITTAGIEKVRNR